MIGKERIPSEFSLFLSCLFVDFVQAVRHKVLQCSAQKHIRREGQPQGVVTYQWLEGVEEGEIGDGGVDHRVAHNA